MLTPKQSREQYLIELVDRHHITCQDALTLQKIAHRLHSLDEAAAIRELTEMQEQRWGRIRQQTFEIARRYGWGAYLPQNPKVPALYLVPSHIPVDEFHARYTKGVAVVG